jgi:hypothetical protein
MASMVHQFLSFLNLRLTLRLPVIFVFANFAHMVHRNVCPVSMMIIEGADDDCGYLVDWDLAAPCPVRIKDGEIALADI